MLKRRISIETKINHERWLVSYSDFITLLFAFFVVMYSVSQVNEKKYRVLSDTLQSAFSQSRQSPVGEEDAEFDTLAPLTQVETELTELLQGSLKEGALSVWGNEDWVEIELNANVLFSSASADPSAEAIAIFSQLANTLSPFENAIAVSGHTDNIPIRNANFDNNWALSSARAVAVVNLLAFGGVDPTRLSAIGYGEYQPVADNATAEGRASNRRVILRVARSQLPAPREDAEELMAASGMPSEVDATAEPELLTPPSEGELAPNNQQADDVVKPIKLPSGGLLFTSDAKGRGTPE